MNTIKEVFGNIDDQIENLIAVKGDAYGKSVGFIASFCSVGDSLMSILATDGAEQKTVDKIAIVLDVCAGHITLAYSTALGLTFDQHCEAIDDGQRITLSARNHMEHTA